MTPSEHRDKGREYISLATFLARFGHVDAAGEMLWGAMDHITQAVALHHGLTTMRRRAVVEWMDTNSLGATPFAGNFNVVARLHGHFYHGHLTPQVHATYMGTGFAFIQDLLAHPQMLAIP